MQDTTRPTAQIIQLVAEDVDLPHGEELDVAYWSETEFRAVVTTGGRKGLKLERAFWFALSSISKRLGIKRTSLIRDVLQDASEQGITNAASALRSYAAGRLASDLEQARELTSTAFVIKVMQKAPVASIAVDRSRRLIHANPEFHALVKRLVGSADEKTLVDQGALWRETQVIVHTPIADLFEQIRSTGKSCESLVSIRVGGNRHELKMRMVGVPSAAPEALVGFVMP